jgi:DUF4097 and DUF4098 domain-containing protein YvlB
MRKIFFAFAICALAASSAPSAAQRWYDETENVSRTLKLEPGGKLVLKSFSGRVTITGTDAAEVVVNAVRRAPRERLNRITLDIHGEGSNTVYIDANHRDHSWYSWGNNVVDTDLEVKVPRKTNLDVSVFSAGVTVDGVEGSHKMNGFSSRITLNDVSGPVKAHTFSGPIIIRQKNWEPNQQIDVDTFSGNVELHVPETAKGTVSFNSFSGHLNSEMPLTLHSTSRKNFRAELGGGGEGMLRFKTFSGSVRIDR